MDDDVFERQLDQLAAKAREMKIRILEMQHGGEAVDDATLELAQRLEETIRQYRAKPGDATQ